MEAPELKPCPFCGGEAETHERMDENIWDHSQVTWVSVSCGNIDCDFQGFDWPLEAEPNAFGRWNTRADTALQEEVERLREALKRVATPSAFYVATSNVDPEAYGRMVYAEMVLKGSGLHEAEAEAEAAVRSRFAPPLKEGT
ncbi:Lar family restriction alleviation protein [Phaeobacter inhibens]|uniref:Lar family restriction alleviation protein n=1 Tax=Phaeobacter inhibens TaxID=221822 RepID=UPI000C9B6CFC|nr:Lar family restriction alleviation protein [Phaeobacter inhibens]AUQ64392.1 restriction alleviation protein, Lar family [Phaeobacter inhibens]